MGLGHGYSRLQKCYRIACHLINSTVNDEGDGKVVDHSEEVEGLKRNVTIIHERPSPLFILIPPIRYNH